MTVELLSGNEALARGAYEAGVTAAFGYPGTPSTEILEYVAAHFRDAIYGEWSPNEKVAFEAAAGAAYTGARTLCTMKHVGLNVAADPLMTMAYTGTVGGFVAIVADDPGMHSSQNEQDTRRYAAFARIPCFEPADSQDAADVMRAAYAVSEQHRTPVIVRTTTRVSHSRSRVVLRDREPAPLPVGFVKDPARFVPIPLWARPMRVRVEERYAALRTAAEQSPLNRIEWRDRKLGIIAPGIAYQYVREVFPEYSTLKLGFTHPYPDALLREFAAGCAEVLVVEELDPLVEEHCRVLGLAVRGRDLVSGIGELSPLRLREVRARWEGAAFAAPQPIAAAADLPGRPPVLCPGCPHRGVFAALAQHDVVVTGDIGCYSLGVLPPLARMDTILCMGGGVSLAHGMDKAGEPKPVVGIVGDSTFFHSGITGLLNIAYNRGKATIIVVDNRTTGMTGHQDNPGTGRTLLGEPSPAVRIEDVARACGIRRVVTLNPYDLTATSRILAEELAADEPSLLVSVAPCVLKVRQRVGPVRTVAAAACKKCRACLKIGCPAIESADAGQPPRINPELCNGCGLCAKVCRFSAIIETEVRS
ncbi:MAG TPA: indolepyruvate ferredoxin oxidoreductase subunit alpha [bacterium]|nr:indolepyruvate ferredoxin oxidoreductase subunit alpha [bacterium]